MIGKKKGAGLLKHSSRTNKVKLGLNTNERIQLSYKNHNHSTQEETTYILETKPSLQGQCLYTPRTNRKKSDKDGHRSCSPKSDRKWESPKAKIEVLSQLHCNKLKKNVKKGKVKSGSKKQKNTYALTERPKREMRMHSYDRKQYENFLIRQSEERAITQRSEQSDISSQQKPINLLKMISQTNNTTRISQALRGRRKVSSFRELKQKIYQKYSLQFSFLSRAQLKFYCSVVLIQRLWRQRKIKRFINDFIKHDGVSNSSSQTNRSKQAIIGQTQTLKTADLIIKYQEQSTIKQRRIASESKLKKTRIIEIQKESMHEETQREENNVQKISVCESQLSKIIKNHICLDMSDKSSLGSDQKTVVMRVADCMKDLTMKSHSRGSKKKSSLSSFSQKCLVHRLYSKVASKKADSLSKNFSQVSQSFQINPVKPQNPTLQIIQLKEQQAEKQLRQNSQSKQDRYLRQQYKKILQFNDQVFCPCLSKDLIRQPQLQIVEQVEEKTRSAQIQTSPSNVKTTLQNLSLITQSIVSSILSQFTYQYRQLVGKGLQQKDKAVLPGLWLTPEYITRYLQNFTSYILSQNSTTILRRYNAINPLCYLKLHYDYDDQSQQNISEIDQEFNEPIIPKHLFYLYQLKFQEDYWATNSKEQHYRNFMTTLLKIGNLLLSNVLSEVLQTDKILKFCLPWDKFDGNCRVQTLKGENGLRKKMEQVVTRVREMGTMSLGGTGERDEQYQKLRLEFRQQYECQWNKRDEAYQMLQLRLQLADYIKQILCEQLSADIFHLIR